MPFDAAKADRAVRFIESLPHVKGRWAKEGLKLKLLPWQLDLIRELFGRVDEEGRRQYRTALVETPRKSGKSHLAASILLYLLFADDEQGAEIYGAATDKEQAAIVYDIAAAMVRKTPALDDRAEVVDYRKRIIFPERDSFYAAIASDTKGSHGLNSSGIVFDELHTQESRDFWDVLTTGTGAREQPLIVAITTAGFFKPESFAWKMHEYAKSVLEGAVEDPTFLPVIYGAEPDDDWTDPAVWRKANPSLGHTVPETFIEGECHQAKQFPSKIAAFKRLYLNIWTAEESRWLSREQWAQGNGGPDEAELAGRRCFGGLDLSTTRDLSALVLVFPAEDGSYDVLSRFWVPEKNAAERQQRDRVPYLRWAEEGLITLTPGAVVDYAWIRREIKELAARFALQEIAFDPYNAVQIAIQLAEEDGINMVQFRQGFLSLSPATKELEKLILGGQLRHGGNPVLAWNAANVVLREDAAGNIKPDKARSTERIDGAVALAMAIGRASVSREDEAVELGELLVL